MELLAQQTGPNHRSYNCAQAFKTKNILLLNEWLGEMTKIGHYEQFIFKLNNRQEVFLKILGPNMNIILNVY